MDKARMNTTAAHPVVACAYAQLSVLDGEDPALQALAPALLFLTICQEMRLDVSEMLAKVALMSKHDDTPFQREMAALRSYIHGELNKA